MQFKKNSVLKNCTKLRIKDYPNEIQSLLPLTLLPNNMEEANKALIAELEKINKLKMETNIRYKIGKLCRERIVSWLHHK